MAGAEEAVEVALMRDRDATKVSTNADQHLPIFVAGLDALFVRLWIRQRRNVHGAGFLDLLLGSMRDVDWLAAPEYFDGLAFCDRRKIDFDRRTGCDGRSVRIHLGNQRPNGSSRA